MAANQRQDRPAESAPRNIESRAAIHEWLSCWMATVEVAPATRERVGRQFAEAAAMHRRPASQQSSAQSPATVNDKSPIQGAQTINTMATSQEIDHDRRRFLGTAIAAAITASLAWSVLALRSHAMARTATIDAASHTLFASLKQIEAGLLNVGYAEAGPDDGPAVILLHGWPYDIYSFVDVAPLLGIEGLPRDRPISARIWHNRFPVPRNGAERPAIGGLGRRHRSDGCAEDPEGDPRGI